MRGKYSEQQKIATDKFLSENYEQIKFSVRKGKRDKIKELAAMKGESVTSLIMTLIEQEAERMGFDMTTAPTPSQQRKAGKIIEDKINETAKETAVEIATNLIITGIGKLDEIAKATGLPLDEVKAIADKTKPAAT